MIVGLVLLLFLCVGLGLFVWSLFLKVRTVQAPTAGPEPKDLSAAKGAESFGPQDGELFNRLGRHLPIAWLHDRCLDPRVPLIVLEGKPGVGKTSLLRCGLAHSLRDDRDLAVFYSSIEAADPVVKLLADVGAEWPFEEPRPAKIGDLLASAKQFVVILDHVEELDRKHRRKLFGILRDALAASTNRITWVLAFRNDYKKTWREFANSLPKKSENRIPHGELPDFTKRKSFEVLAVMVSESGLKVDPRVLDDLVSGLVDEQGRVSPLDLGIYFHSLSNVASSPSLYTLDSFRNTGGHIGFLSKYLKSVLARFSDTERSEALKALFLLAEQERDRRLGKEFKELRNEVRPTRTLRFLNVLGFLASPQARILEPVPQSPAQSYRLTSDRLAKAVRRLSEDIFDDAKKASELLNEKYDTWRQGAQTKKLLLSGRDLRQVLSHRVQIPEIRQDHGKREFVTRSLRRRRFLIARAVCAVLFVAVLILAGFRILQAGRGELLLEAWGLPGDLYDYQVHLVELSLPEAVNSTEWLRSGVQELNLEKTKILDLKDLPESIRSLNLAGATSVSDLDGLPDSLTSLDLRGTKVRRLRGLPSTITDLELRGTAVSSLDGLPKSIEKLGLRATKVTNLEGLPDSIKELDLRDTKVTNLDTLPGAIGWLALSATNEEELKELPHSVTVLDLERVKLANLKDVPPSVETLELDRAQVESLEGMPGSVTELHLDGVELPSPADLPASITSLDLSKARNVNLEEIPDWLSSLNLSNVKGINSVRGLPGFLSNLDLSYTGVTNLIGLPKSIEVLNLSGTDIKSLTGLPKSVTSLDLRGCEFLTSLKGLPDSVTKLDISNSGVATLKDLPDQLEELTLAVGQAATLKGLPSNVRRLHFVD